MTAAVLTSISVTPSSATLSVSGTQQLTATGTYSDSSTPDITNSVSWVSSDTAVATVSSTGLVTAVAGGSATITASLSGQNDTSVITVNLFTSCGTGLNDTGSTNATGVCLKLADDGSGNWFTSTPSLALMNTLGYTQATGESGGKTYARTYDETGPDPGSNISGGPAGTFVEFDLLGHSWPSAVGGQAYRYCQDLASISFAGKSDWRLPTSAELEAFTEHHIGGAGTLYTTYGWPTDRPYWSSTENAFETDKFLNTHIVYDYTNSNLAQDPKPVSCISDSN